MLVRFVFCFEECGRLWIFELEGVGCSKQNLMDYPGRSLGSTSAESHADCGSLGQGDSEGNSACEWSKDNSYDVYKKCGFLLSTNKELTEGKFKSNKLSY